MVDPLTHRPDPPDLGEAREAIASARAIVVLTGAGVSAESGLATFRDPEEGLWAKVRPEELATPQAFSRDPCRVWGWYDMRRRRVMASEPNEAHRALARLLLTRPGATLVTQNVDGLHQRALEEEAERANAEAPALENAARRILPLHGSLLEVRCSACSYRRVDREPVDWSSRALLPRCVECEALLRPAVIWFGEMLPQAELSAAFEAGRRADLCLAVGTSALVHPAASVPSATLASGGTLIEVNPQETVLTPRARWSLRGGAARLLPALLEKCPRPDSNRGPTA